MHIGDECAVIWTAAYRCDTTKGVLHHGQLDVGRRADQRHGLHRGLQVADKRCRRGKQLAELSGDAAGQTVQGLLGGGEHALGIAGCGGEDLLPRSNQVECRGARRGER